MVQVHNDRADDHPVSRSEQIGQAFANQVYSDMANFKAYTATSKSGSASEHFGSLDLFDSAKGDHTHRPLPQAQDHSRSSNAHVDNYLNRLHKGIVDNIGKPLHELEPTLNPRLGCVRMVSHALHQADPTFPETNNTAEFRRALKMHGYEELTVKPGDPAINGAQAGSVIVGSRPDGMPSHAAISIGDGAVFNNNSDSGHGQIDSISKFNQGMHDGQGHWMKQGFNSVTIYRKAQASENYATKDAVGSAI